MYVVSSFSHVWLFVTLWIITCQAPLSIGFSRQEYWSGLPCPSPGNLPNPGIELMSLMSLRLASSVFTTSTTWDTLLIENEYTVSCIFKLHVCVCTQSLSYVGVVVSPWTHQALLFMEFSKKEYWSRLPFPSPGIFPTQESNQHASLALPALSGRFFTTMLPGKPHFKLHRSFLISSSAPNFWSPKLVNNLLRNYKIFLFLNNYKINICIK